MELDKVYIITLDHSDENKESLLERLRILVGRDVPYHFLEGVNGRDTFSTQEGRDVYGIQFYSDWNNGESEWWSRPVTTGEAGGMCSHIKV